LQVFDFIEAKFAILIVFEFFLMTAEYTEVIDMLRVLSASVEILSDEFGSC